MVTQQCKHSQTIADQGWKSCFCLKDVNINHFKMVETVGLKIIALRPPWMASAPYQISWKSTKQFRSWYGGQTHGQYGDLISLFPFLESMLKIVVSTFPLNSQQTSVWKAVSYSLPISLLLHAENMHMTTVWSYWQFYYLLQHFPRLGGIFLITSCSLLIAQSCIQVQPLLHT
jgi:hypothetical protein